MRHTMRHTRLVLTVLSVTAALVATAAAGATPTAGSKLPPKLASGKVQIALVRQLGSGDFFQQWLTGAQKMAKLLKVKLLIYDARGKNEQMATDFQNAMNRGVDAIIVDHGLAETMNPLVDKAVKKGIPVVAFDLATPNKKVTQTQQSDILLGTMIATKMATDLRGKGKVGYVYVAGFAPLDRRNTAWQRVKKKYPGLEQVAQFGKVSDSTASDVQSQAAAVLTANPDLNAILAPYDEFAKGAVLAINQAGKQKRVKVYGVDISTPDIGVMRQPGSPWVATAATDPANVGAVTVRAAVLKLLGTKLPRSILIRPALITQSFLVKNNIKTMADLRRKLKGLNTSDIASAPWMPKITF
jgi:simple sugar transport system substrate-binding protein